MTTTDELHAIDQVSDRLRSRFPDASPDRIQKVVHEVHHQYDGSPIRDFIPVLVEREAADELKTGDVMRQRSRS